MNKQTSIKSNDPKVIEFLKYLGIEDLNFVNLINVNIRAGNPVRVFVSKTCHREKTESELAEDEKKQKAFFEYLQRRFSRETKS